MSPWPFFSRTVLILFNQRSHAQPFVTGIPRNSHKKFASCDVDLMWDEWVRRCLDDTIVGAVSAESLVGFVLLGERPANAPQPFVQPRRAPHTAAADAEGAHTVTTVTTTTRYYGPQPAGGYQ